MAAHHRANRKTLETVYRVYRLPENLRKQIKAKREKHNVTLQSVIEASATESLPKIVCHAQDNGVGLRWQEASGPVADDRFAAGGL